jgi:nucleotide-binding universal stress UspA family protein
VRVLAWVTEAGWEACVDAAAALPATEITLLHVADPVPTAVPLGRHPREDVGARVAAVAGAAATALLADAEARLRAGAGGVAASGGTAATPLTVHRVAVPGRPESIVTAAAATADVLVLARDGRRPGPHSLGHASRYIVDHAPCTVLLAWPPR